MFYANIQKNQTIYIKNVQIMAKKQIRLNESELKNLIRESVINFLNENMDELTPGFAIHAAHAAADDKKKHPGRGKNSPDPAIRAKRDAQIKKFGDYAADAMNSEMDDPDFMVIGDRGARRMMYANGDNSAYLTNDLDDVNTANALTVLYDLLKDESVNNTTKLELITNFDKVFDINLIKSNEVDEELLSYIKLKIEERKQAKANKDFELADKVRNELLEKGIQLKDTREGTTFEIIR